MNLNKFDRHNATPARDRQHARVRTAATPRRRRPSFISTLLLASCACLIAGCAKVETRTGSSNSGSANNTKLAPVSAPRRSSSEATSLKAKADQQGLASAPDTGNFTVQYTEVQNENYTALNENLRNEKILEQIADSLNATVAIPESVSITFKECGEVNAFWSPRDRQIVMCFEFIEDTAVKFKQVAKSEQELNDAVSGAVTFAFIHEVGHCLIDVLKLPATGREEDSVDQLATYVLIDSNDADGEQMALNGARMWGLWFQEKGGTAQTADKINWADEHSLDAQRFFNIICWVYGHNAEKWQGLINNPLPENRAVRCPTEYSRLSNAWMTLLKPYMKNGGANVQPQPGAETIETAQ